MLNSNFFEALNYTARIPLIRGITLLIPLSRRQTKSKFCHKVHKEMHLTHDDFCATYDKNAPLNRAKPHGDSHRKNQTPLSHLCTKKIEGYRLPSGNEVVWGIRHLDMSCEDEAVACGKGLHG